MQNSLWKLSAQNPGGQIRSLLFFILFYLYLWLEVELHLIYHSSGMIKNFPVFFRGWAFFQQFTAYPGGPVEYLSAFLSQFFYYSWAGAFIVTLQAWLIFIFTGYFFMTINAGRLYWIRFIPPILLLIIYNQYTYHFVSTMALLTAFAFVYLYLKITSKNKFLCIAVFSAMSVVLYAVAGGAQMLFAVICAIYELLLRPYPAEKSQNGNVFGGRWPIGLICLLSALVIPYVEGVIVFGVSIIDAFSKLMPFSWEILFDDGSRRMVTMVYILYLLVPLALLGVGFWRPLFGSFKFSWLNKGIFSWYFRKNKFRHIIKSLAPFVVAGAAVFFSYRNEIKTFHEVDYYVFHKMWPKALAAAYRYPTNNFYVVHSANLALYHTGRLGYDMFSYPQHPDAFLLLPKKSTTGYWQRFDTYIDLGFISRAEHSLATILDEFGERPMILKRLALVNIIKGNINVARIYLRALNKTLFDADWAADYLNRLEQTPDLVTNDRIQYLRRSMTEKDYRTLFFINEPLLLDLLEKNRQNRMAFEYLMAWYLLNGQLDRFAQNLERLDDFSYSEIPRLYEEAILYMLNREKVVKLHDRQISTGSRQRFADFLHIYNRHGRNKNTALKELKKKYGDSYLFYSLYGFSGAEK
ncbi:MAG: DUF6057 family protein [Planctomycetota bacterium]|jgi:hypothetical protein